LPDIELVTKHPVRDPARHDRYKEIVVVV